MADFSILRGPQFIRGMTPLALALDEPEAIAAYRMQEAMRPFDNAGAASPEFAGPDNQTYPSWYPTSEMQPFGATAVIGPGIRIGTRLAPQLIDRLKQWGGALYRTGMGSGGGSDGQSDPECDEERRRVNEECSEGHANKWRDVYGSGAYGRPGYRSFEDCVDSRLTERCGGKPRAPKIEGPKRRIWIRNGKNVTED